MNFFVGASLNPGVQVLLRGASEGECTSQHNIKQHAKCPNVNWHSFIVRLPCDFRCHVAGRPTEHFEPLLWLLNKYTESKVNQFDHACAFLKQNVV